MADAPPDLPDLPDVRLTADHPVGAAADGAGIVLALPMTPGQRNGGPVPAVPGAGADQVTAALGLDLAAHLARAEAKGQPGEVVSIPVTGDAGVSAVLLVGVGDGGEPALRKAAAAAARRAGDAEALVTTLAADRPPASARAVVEAVQLASYRFTLRSEPKRRRLRSITLAGVRPREVRQAVDRGTVTARAVALARDLCNTPSLQKTPAWFADRAVAVAERAGVEVRVRDERQLAGEGFGGILAVGMGSARPPRLVELTYAPRRARGHVVLAGKGITFDSGGLSLKPREGMVAMKTDMTGGAVVVGVMSALAELGIRTRVTGLVAMAENMPSGAAMRPSDVIRHYGGRTVEVLNTDAEGRLVLADALAYADRHLDADVVIDVATLTGAATLALGRRTGALFSPDDALAAELIAAADAGGERLWRLPLVEEYRSGLDSTVADLRNIADRDFEFSGGSIIAALFLREFTGGRRWAHLDIAGPARSEKDEDEINKGGTAFGVRTLLRYLERRSGGDAG